MAEVLGPVEAVMGKLPAGFSARYDAASDTVTLDDGATSVVLTRRTFATAPTFSAPGGIRAIRTETASGAGSSIAAVWRPEELAGPVYARLSETRMPTEGSAVFSGTYRSLLVDDAATSVEFELEGDAAFTADLGAGTISGRISDRRGIGGSSVRYDDLTLEQTAITDGAFSGTASGGAGSVGTVTTTVPGSYGGLFTGADGQEIVGGVLLAHDEAGFSVLEYGVFAAERSGP